MDSIKKKPDLKLFQEPRMPDPMNAATAVIENNTHCDSSMWTPPVLGSSSLLNTSENDLSQRSKVKLFPPPPFLIKSKCCSQLIVFFYIRHLLVIFTRFDMHIVISVNPWQVLLPQRQEIDHVVVNRAPPLLRTRLLCMTHPYLHHRSISHIDPDHQSQRLP